MSQEQVLSKNSVSAITLFSDTRIKVFGSLKYGSKNLEVVYIDSEKN